MKIKNQEARKQLQEWVKWHEKKLSTLATGNKLLWFRGVFCASIINIHHCLLYILADMDLNYSGILVQNMRLQMNRLKQVKEETSRELRIKEDGK